MKARKVYAIAAALIVVSWIGNYLYFRSSQLPEAGFLSHHIEVTDGGGSFNLLYVANRQDDRRITNITVEELPELQFYPPTVHTELRHQTIYRVIGMFNSGQSDTTAAPDPLVIHTVHVYFSDGTEAKQDIGEIRLYRRPLPISDQEPPFHFVSTSGSSDHSGSTMMSITRPVSLTGISSAWTPLLGSAFHLELTANSRNVPLADAAPFPVELGPEQAVSVSHRFLLPAGHALSMEVFYVVLRMPFREANGREWTGMAHAHYDPYPTDREMRAYVREKRREGP